MKISKQRKRLGFGKWTKIFVQNPFFPRKILQKSPDFHFCPNMQSFLIFSSKITTATFFGEFRLGLLSNNLGKTSSGYPKSGKTVIRLPKKREKRHPVTQKAGKTSSGYPKSGKTVIRLLKNGKNVIQFVQSCEMQSPDDLYERIIERNQTNLFL
jgi:hypothetical protein